MIKKNVFWLFVLLFFVSVSIFSQRVSIQGKKFKKNDKTFFLSGINSPWQNDEYYRIDFLGTNHFRLQFWKDEFEKMQINKVNFVRIWVHGRGNNTPEYDQNGFVKGPSQKFYNDLDGLLNEAKKRKIYVLLTMWSFDMVLKSGNGQPGSSQYQKNRNVIRDWNKLLSYQNNFLAPVVKRYVLNPYLLGYDIINEPEHMWENNNNLVDGQISNENTKRFVAACAVTIHEASNYKNFTTVGSKWIIYNSSKYNGWNNESGDNWSNASLKAQYGGHTAAYLDFYSMHWYQWQSTGTPFRDKASSLYPGVNKPIVIGEFPGQDLPNNTCGCTCNTPGVCDFNIKLKNVYVKLKNKGYAGVTAWRNGTEDDGFGKSSKIYEATRFFANKFPNLVFPTNTSSRSQSNNIVISDSGLEEAGSSNIVIHANNLLEGKIMLEIRSKEVNYIDVKVFNSVGQLVYSKETTNLRKEEPFIYLDSFNSTKIKGVLFFKIKTNESMKTYKILHCRPKVLKISYI